MLPMVNILLVDDEQRNLDALEIILDDPRYRVLRADDADKALRLLLEHDVAAIVLDIKMPGVSGFELAKMIKGAKRYREIPIVFLTAYMVGDQDVIAGYGAGAVDYLTKPVNPQILRHKIAVFAELFWKTRALADLNATLETRVRERTAELEKSEAALRAASLQKDTFLATLAHELRNPLAPLRTGLDLLLQMPQPTPSVTRTLATMNRQLDHMVRLVDDLIDVARISRGMLELKRELLDLNAIVETAIETAQPFMDRRQQTCRVESAGPLFAVVDATRIAQVIGNLLHNASKYTPVKGEICIEMSMAGSNACIRVIDCGVGIPQSQLERVFDMFAKIERSMPNANAGLGIGLALSRQLALLHAGSLVADSVGEGRGATFTLSLPLAEVTSVVSRREGANAPSSQTEQLLKIVVIEDNEDAAELLATLLEGMGHRVRIGRSGTEGLALVREVVPQIVFCDLGLPGMNGLEVCKQVRGLELSSQPVMVALTGWGMTEERRQTREAGFDHHLVKPATMEALLEILRDQAEKPSLVGCLPAR
ncbi:MAG TPA: response regulator [Polyangiaceae bacterium]|nr:response regulator [Polyangiaceae bacterium]